MSKHSEQAKKAWEYNTYDFWVVNAGLPKEKAKEIMDNPIRSLKRYSNYFEHYENVKIANICGSCGKKAIPLAVLGAD